MNQELSKKDKREILERRFRFGQHAKACEEFMLPLLDAMEKDCFEAFISLSENNYQKIDNSCDFVLKSEMKVVREIKAALTAAIDLGTEAQELMEQENAKHERGNR